MNRSECLRRLSAAKFAAWETHLFLDTHPGDAAAAEDLAAYQKEADELRAEYEKRFGPLTAADLYRDTRAAWLNDPWPWENAKEAD